MSTEKIRRGQQFCGSPGGAARLAARWAGRGAAERAVGENKTSDNFRECRQYARNAPGAGGADISGAG